MTMKLKLFNIKEFIKKIFLILLLTSYHLLTFSQNQLKISNGICVPTRGDIRVFVVFAELDYADGPCPCNNLANNFDPGSKWPVIDGITQVPIDAETYFSPDARSFKNNPAFITGLYHEASFGKYRIFGDYYPKVITIPCKNYQMGNDGVNLILQKLDEETTVKGTLYTKHGLTLKDFDKWTPTPQGQPKINVADGKIDILYIIWKNNRFITDCNTGGNSGYGLSPSTGIPFKDFKGVNARSSFNAVNSAPGGYNVALYEYMHGPFGGNHWHSGGGAGNHTVIAPPSNYGLTGQSDKTMQSVSAWDRWMLDYQHPLKTFLISALDQEGKETDTETISLESHPDGGIFILRDFTITGDALRIKLPYLNDVNKQVKNQYLWLENRLMKSRYEKYTEVECADYGRYRYGTPGIYAYLQIGKDVKEGGNEIYASSPFSLPNALASFIVPFTAEGNYDICHRRDLEQPGMWICGNWQNKNYPKDMSCSKANPFTGFSDLFMVMDVNKDGVLYSGEKGMLGLSEVVSSEADCKQPLQDGNVCHNYHKNGDWKDAFGFATGKTRINISTNPAPVPIYTYVSGYAYSSPNKKAPENFENRKIWLNGLSIEIIDEAPDQKKFGKGAVMVSVRWDNYFVDDHVRWCGDIVLSPHIKNQNAQTPQKISLNLKKGKTLLLDRGDSPTQYVATSFDSLLGEYVFTDPTIFTCLQGSWMNVEENASIEIDNKSRLILKNGSRLELQNNARLTIKNGSELVIEDGAEFLTDPKAKIVLESGGKLVRKN
jgi:hypothetical protein